MRSRADARAAGVAQHARRPHHVVVVLEAARPGPGTRRPWSAAPGDSRRTASACSTISQGSRLRRKPSRPVSQKEQASAQPTCEETQTLQRGFSSGMRTASKTRPSGRAEQVLDEGIDLAAAAVEDLEPVEPAPLPKVPARALDKPRHAGEIVPVLADQPMNDAPRHR